MQSEHITTKKISLSVALFWFLSLIATNSPFRSLNKIVELWPPPCSRARIYDPPSHLWPIPTTSSFESARSCGARFFIPLFRVHSPSRNSHLCLLLVCVQKSTLTLRPIRLESLPSSYLVSEGPHIPLLSVFIESTMVASRTNYSLKR
jgi:hypothetical protein